MLPLCGLAKEQKLDSTGRAHSETLKWGYEVTEARFREMQRNYRPEHFGMWAKKLADISYGISEKQLIHALGAKQRGTVPKENGSFYSEIVQLDDAYCTLVLLDKRERVLAVSTPVAITYQVQPEHKKPPKT